MSCLLFISARVPGGIRWSNGANFNDVYSNRIKTSESGDFAIYMCEFDLFDSPSLASTPINQGAWCLLPCRRIAWEMHTDINDVLLFALWLPLLALASRTVVS